ncbi:MAG: hypothetical protein IPK12_23600 [Gemmatimonadetes bacterium]|nr:hypothetical protein [Gemmatimonadota bacterium]
MRRNSDWASIALLLILVAFMAAVMVSAVQRERACRHRGGEPTHGLCFAPGTFR